MTVAEASGLFGFAGLGIAGGSGTGVFEGGTFEGGGPGGGVFEGGVSGSGESESGGFEGGGFEGGEFEGGGFEGGEFEGGGSEVGGSTEKKRIVMYPALTPSFNSSRTILPSLLFLPSARSSSIVLLTVPMIRLVAKNGASLFIAASTPCCAFCGTHFLLYKFCLSYFTVNFKFVDVLSVENSRDPSQTGSSEGSFAENVFTTMRFTETSILGDSF